MLNLNHKVFIFASFLWWFCWALRYNISSTFHWKMRNIFKIRIQMSFITLINGLDCHTFLDLSLLPAYLLHLFNGNINNRIHNKQCMINSAMEREKYMLKRMSRQLISPSLFINNNKAVMMAFKHWEDLTFDVKIIQKETKVIPKIWIYLTNWSAKI